MTVVNPFDFKKEVCKILKLKPSEINKIQNILDVEEYYKDGII